MSKVVILPYDRYLKLVENQKEPKLNTVVGKGHSPSTNYEISPKARAELYKDLHKKLQNKNKAQEKGIRIKKSAFNKKQNQKFKQGKNKSSWTSLWNKY